MTPEDLKKEILAKTAEYYRLVHQAKQQEQFVPGKSRVNYAGRVFDESEMRNLLNSGSLTDIGRMTLRRGLLPTSASALRCSSIPVHRPIFSRS